MLWLDQVCKLGKNGEKKKKTNIEISQAKSSRAGGNNQIHTKQQIR